MRRRAAAQALRQRALGAEVYLRSPNRDWVCICADDEGLVLLDADDEDTVVAVPWTEADIDDLEHVAEMYTDAAIMDDEEDELDILDQLVRDYDIGRGTGRGRGSYARARSNL